MNILSIDQSLTASGFAVSKEGNIFKSGEIKVKSEGPKRLSEIREEIRKLIQENDIELVTMEDYTYLMNGGGGRVFGLGELGGMIKLLCYDLKIPMKIYNASSIKKWATGKGNAKKDLMIKAVFKKWDFDVDSDNIADAYAQNRLAYAHYQIDNNQRSLEDFNEYEKETLKALNKKEGEKDGGMRDIQDKEREDKRA
jgi:crossover junction endodeoxyribonuclease RuvC